MIIVHLPGRFAKYFDAYAIRIHLEMIAFLRAGLNFIEMKRIEADESL